MNNTEFIINRAINTTQLNKTQLAKSLNGGSNKQFGQWIKNNMIPFEFERTLIDLCQFDGILPALIQLIGNQNVAKNWVNLIKTLAQAKQDSSESGYILDVLNDEDDLLAFSLIYTLTEAGFSQYKEFPKECTQVLNILENEESDDGEFEEAWELIEKTPVLRLLSETLYSLGAHYSFYVAYISDLEDQSNNEYSRSNACNIEYELIALCVSKINDDELLKLLPKIKSYKNKIIKQYTQWINTAKDIAIKHNAVIKIEFLDLINLSVESLESEAERESFKKPNKTSQHINIYNNRIESSNKIIPIILNAICEKLNIDKNAMSTDHESLEHPNHTTNSSLQMMHPTHEMLNQICMSLDIDPIKLIENAQIV
jgi:hypothetical protein